MHVYQRRTVAAYPRGYKMAKQVAKPKITFNTQAPNAAKAAAMLAQGAPAWQVAAVAMGHTIVPGAAPVTAPVTAPVAAPVAAPTVALRGGAAVALVQVVPGTVYRTKAPHNVAWWATITGQATAAPAAVATLCAAPHSVPTHFVGYCLRRGYLVAAPAAPAAPATA
jgi:hypothetical protein